MPNDECYQLKSINYKSMLLKENLNKKTINTIVKEISNIDIILDSECNNFKKETWNKLQKNELHKNSCGRPGINGGYFENPYIKFGVNCFGKKPKPTDLEKQMMQAQIDEPIPQTEEEIALQEKVKYYQENGDQLLQVNSFNKKKWSRY